MTVMSVLPALDAHLQHLRLRGLAATHITARRRAVERLAGHLGADPAGATPTDLLDYLGRIPRTTPRSKYAEISHLCCYYRWLNQHGHRSDDPTVTLPKPKLSRLLPRPMSEGDLAVAIASAPPKIRLWLVLAGYQGLRACEIACLDRSDILDNAPTPALVAHGKGRKDRIVPLCDRALAELRAYGLPSRGPLFPRADGAPGPTSAHRVSCIANEYLHDLSITDTLHQLRHRAATGWYAASQDILVTGALLGHSDPASTAGYAAYSDARATAAVRALDAQYA